MSRIEEHFMRKRMKQRMLEGKARRSLSSLLFEDADPAKIDFTRFPKKLSAAKADTKMKDKTTRGTEDGQTDDDKVEVNTAFSAPVSTLFPSQSTMKVSNAVGMAIGMLAKGEIGGNLEAFVSKDNFIMDGHHRWIASYMCDPAAVVKGTQVMLPGEQLVAILNAFTAGRTTNAPNPGKGSFADFKNKDEIVKQINIVAEKGVPKFERGTEPPKQIGYFTTPEDAKKAIDEQGGADKLADKFISNLSTAKLETPSWAVERIEMPVIEPGQNAADAQSAFTKGEIDMNPPYAGEAGTATGGTTSDKQPATTQESRTRGDSFMVERWQRLAGLIKD